VCGNKDSSRAARLGIRDHGLEAQIHW
jgi:hypothetical protein